MSGKRRYDYGMIGRVWRDHSPKETAEIIGAPASTVKRIAKEMGYTHSQETMERMERERRERMARPLLNERARILRVVDRRREAEGSEVKRKWRLGGGVGEKKRKCARHLAERYGYIYDTFHPMSVGYDERTRRLPESIEKLHERRGMRFYEVKN